MENKSQNIHKIPFGNKKGGRNTYDTTNKSQKALYWIIEAATTEYRQYVPFTWNPRMGNSRLWWKNIRITCMHLPKLNKCTFKLCAGYHKKILHKRKKNCPHRLNLSKQCYFRAGWYLQCSLRCTRRWADARWQHQQIPVNDACTVHQSPKLTMEPEIYHCLLVPWPL